MRWFDSTRGHQSFQPVSVARPPEYPLIVVRSSEDAKLQALIRMEVACRLALDSLPDLPQETEEALREHIEVLCRVAGHELRRLRPDSATP